MPNDVVSRAIDAVCAGDHLTADHAAAVLAEIMEGRADPVQTGAFLIALRAKGETVPELVGLARTMRVAGDAGLDQPLGPRRHRRHRRRALDLQRLDHGGAGRRRGRLRRRQARQPLQHEQVRLRRPARGARRQHRARARSGRALHRRDRLRLHVRPPPPRGDGARGPGPQGARSADDLQLPRPADQPGRAPNRQLLGVADRHYQETIAEALVGLGSVRALVVSAEDGLDELSIAAPHPGDRGRRRRHLGVVRRAGQFGLAPAALADGRRRRRRRRTPPPSRAVLAGEPGPRRDLACSTPPPRSTSAASPRTSRPGVARRGGGDRLGRGSERAGAADRGNHRLTRRLGSSCSSGNDRAAHRRGPGGSGRASPRAPAGRPRVAPSGRGEDRPFNEALVRPGLSLIAEFKRRSPSAGEISADARSSPTRSAPTSAAAPPRSRCSPTSPTSAARSTDLRAARAACELPILRKDFIVDPYQLYEAAVNGADAVLLIVARARRRGAARRSTRRRARSTSTAWSRSTTSEELERALEADAEVIGINNRNLDEGTVDLATTFELMPDVPAGKTVVAESGISGRAELRGAGAGRRRRGADRRRADGAPTTPRRRPAS